MKTTSIALGLLLTLAAATPAQAQVSAFTYQGRLSLNGTPANGHYDFMFRLLNDPTNGVAVPVIPVALAVPVSNGLFTTGMDFGAENFDGANRWLEISVCTNGSGSFTTLSPRQALTPAPYAIQSAFASSSVSVSGPVSAAQLTGTILSDNIGAGSISSVMLAAGAVGPNQLAAGAVTTGALADGAVTAAKVATVSNWFALTIGNPTPAVDDSFGFSMVAVGNDRVLIGAHFDDTGATDAGAAYLFRTNGSLLVTFTNPTPAYNDSFGISVAAVGSDRVLIGASLDDTGATDAGAAYLFTTNGVLLTTFTNPTAGSLDQFGYPVAAVGDNLVLIGARYDDTTAPNAGAAYLFNFNGRLLTSFTNPTPTANQGFGSSVAAVGAGRVLIGAPFDNTGASGAGTTFLFSTDGALLTSFTNPTPEVGDLFGSSMAVVGTDRVLIGAPSDDTAASGAGAAYLFTTNGVLLTTFTNPTPTANQGFGSSVAAVGAGRVLIGAPFDNTGASGAGTTFLFSTDGALLTSFTNPTPEVGDLFGSSMAVVGADRLLIGAHFDNKGENNAGAAYLYSLESFTPGLVGDGVRAGSITTASLEDGAVTAAKVGGVLFANQIPELDASKIRSGVLDTNRIPGLDASKIASGTLADTRLSANVALLNRTNVFTGTNRFAGVTLATNANNQFTGRFVGNGSGLTNLNAASLTGTISSNNIGAGSITTASLEDGAVTAAKLDPTIGVWTRTGDDAFRLGGNVGIGTSSFTSNRLQVAGMVGATAFNTTSDRAAKQDFTAVDARAVLDKLTALPITQWRFKDFPGALHLGPMAQDFRTSFGLGLDDVSIATVDADGVALAAIQGLNQKLEETRAENAELRKRLMELESRIESLREVGRQH